MERPFNTVGSSIGKERGCGSVACYKEKKHLSMIKSRAKIIIVYLRLHTMSGVTSSINLFSTLRICNKFNSENVGFYYLFKEETNMKITKPSRVLMLVGKIQKCT